MEIEQIEKLRVLVHSDDIENVRMGLELCDVLVFEVSDVVDLFGLEGVSDTQSLSLSQQKYPHGRPLYGWLLCKLLELEVSWVTELTALDLSGCALKEVPEAVLHHCVLEGLDLSFNEIQKLPDLHALTHLRWLSIFGNPLDIRSAFPVLEGLGLEAERCVISLSDVPRGHFIMGPIVGDTVAHDYEGPRHAVEISRDMRVMKVPVTQWLYELVTGSNPSRFRGLDQPIDEASWYDAVRFANALSAFFGLPPAYQLTGKDVFCDWESKGWRLPTEAEWEYLARGGEAHLYAGSNDIDLVAWYGENWLKDPIHPVGQKRPNGFGLYDMSGNVFEWCWDWYDAYSSASVRDPRGPSSGKDKVCRGGCWYFDAENTRISRRISHHPSHSDHHSFRLIRTL